MKWVKVLLVVVAVLAMMAPIAQAESVILPLFPVVGPPPFTYTYAATLTLGELYPGDHFAIFDFQGLIGGSVFAPPGWAITTPALSPIPNQLIPDSPAVPNLLFTWIAPPMLIGGPLGLFGASSVLPPWQLGKYGGEDSVIFTGGGFKQQNQGETFVPAVPLPVAGWAGLALLSAVGLKRRR